MSHQGLKSLKFDCALVTRALTPFCFKIGGGAIKKGSMYRILFLYFSGCEGFLTVPLTRGLQTRWNDSFCTSPLIFLPTFEVWRRDTRK